ncbi:hypothetical protein QTP86_026061, partial [Hemibagrus guttatus]
SNQHQLQVQHQLQLQHQLQVQHQLQLQHQLQVQHQLQLQHQLLLHRGREMMVTNALGVFMFVVALMVAEGSWGSDKKTSYSYDLSNASDLRKLYNSKVYLADRMTRPLEGQSFQVGVWSHSGVRVTLADGTKWLVHKGDGFGISSQTVVVDARHMSSSWRIRETKNFRGSKTVSDFVRAGGTDYSLLFNNCHNAAGRMMDD